jgi:threonyl-tRNA synthetase
MIDLKFPDGSEPKFRGRRDGPGRRRLDLQIAGEEGPAGQARRPAARPGRPLPHGGAIQIVTRESPEALDTIRHDTAHVLAEAVQELFPGTQVTIGPNVEDGFYYDFARNEPFSLDDLPVIEKRMREIVDRDEKISARGLGPQEAIAHFEGIGETYKAEIIRDIPGDEPITVYRQGAWKDLCRGPHLPSTRTCRQGVQADQARRRLLARRPEQRPAAAHLRHRLGQRGRPRSLPEAPRGGREARPPQARRGHGPLPHPGRGQGHGVLAPQGLDALPDPAELCPRRIEAAGYVEVKTPQILDRSLVGAVRALGEVPRQHVRLRDPRGRDLAVKPMNCPGHVQIFKHGQRSYRELPIRYGRVRRPAPLRELGLAARAAARPAPAGQDDGHIFCREDQVEAESEAFIGC